MDDKQCAVLFREISCTYLRLSYYTLHCSPRAKTTNQNEVATHTECTSAVHTVHPARSVN